MTRALVLVTALALPLIGRADRGLRFDPTDASHALVVDLEIELPVVFASAAIVGTSQLLVEPHGPKKCGWCDTRSSLNGFDRLGMDALDGANRRSAGLGSDLLGYAGMPVVTLGLGLLASLDATRGMPGTYRARRYGIDVLLVTEAAVDTLAVMQLVKFASKRRRPSAIDEPVDGTRAVDRNLSFFSGHTALAFSLATSAAVLATLRHERLAPLVWVVGYVAATATGISRMAADKHFASDVIVGSVVGAGVGALIPVLHRTRVPVHLGGSASSTSAMFSLSGLL